MRFSEAPPAVGGRTSNGGTAVAWKRTLGRCCTLLDDRLAHRAITLKLDGFSCTSVYGPQRVDCQWLDATLEHAAGGNGKAILFGDFNWKQSYGDLLPGDVVLHSTPPTTTKDTFPTRLLASDGVG
eukprot:15461099-Alexandrium_andersonii.AAC.1